MWVSFSNMALNYPIWATLMAGDDDYVHFFNLLDGTEHKLSERDTNYMGLNAIAGQPGRFVLTSVKGGDFAIRDYDFRLNRASTVYELKLSPLLEPFVMDGSYCAMHPRGVTKKRNYYDFEIICNSSDLTLNTEMKPYGTYISYDKIFMIGYSNDGYSILSITKHDANLIPKSYSVPPNYTYGDSVEFIYDGYFHIVSLSSGQCYRLSNAGLGDCHGDVAKRVKAAKLRWPVKILHFGSNVMVAAEADDDAGKIELKIWNADGAVLKTHTQQF